MSSLSSCGPKKKVFLFIGIPALCVNENLPLVFSGDSLKGTDGIQL